MSRLGPALALCLACYSAPTLGTTTEIVPLVIENNSRSDVIVYLVSDGGSRRRIGLVSANRVAHFSLSLSILREAPRVLVRQLSAGEWLTDSLHPVLAGGSITLEVSGLG